MIIKPSRHFEGSNPAPDTWIEYVASRDWTTNDTRTPTIASFFRAAHLGLEKKEAVKRLQAWLRKNTELSYEYMSLMAYANFAYRQAAKKAAEGQ